MLYSVPAPSIYFLLMHFITVHVVAIGILNISFYCVQMHFIIVHVVYWYIILWIIDGLDRVILLCHILYGISPQLAPTMLEL